MEEQNFSKEGGKFVPDVLASVQPVLTSCGGVLESRMNMALVPHSCSYFSSSLCFTLLPSPSPLVPSQLLSLPGRSKQAPACTSAHIPPAVGLAEKGATLPIRVKFLEYPGRGGHSKAKIGCLLR